VDWGELSALRRLALDRNSKAGDLSGLSNCSELRSLDLTETHLSQCGFQNMCTLVGFSKALQCLRIGGCHGGPIVLVLAAISRNTSVAEELDISGSDCSAAMSADASGAGEWVRFCRRCISIKKVRLSRCCIDATHVEELVRTFYESEDPCNAAVAELDLHANCIGDDGADWAAELLALACIKRVRLGDNAIADGTPMCEALRARLRTVGPLDAELCGSGSTHNRFSRDQLTWLAKSGVHDATAAALNGGALPFYPAVADGDARPFGQHA